MIQNFYQENLCGKGVNLDRKPGVTFLRNEGVNLKRNQGVNLNGISNGVSQMLVANNTMYLGGAFSTVNNDTMLFIAQMDLASGINEPINECFQFSHFLHNIYVKSICETLTRFTMYDITGRVVFEKELNSVTSFEPDVSVVNNGFYIVQVETKIQKFSKKFFLQ